MVRDFTAEELVHIQADMAAMTVLWEKFKHQYKTSPDVPLHPPPVLLEAGRSLASEILGMDETNTDFTVLRGIVNICTAMFEFGQFCQRHDYYTSNMVQCICCQVDNAALERLLGDA